MLLIFGLKSYLDLLASGNLVCGNCGNPAAHRLHQLTRKFTLFFMPLFTTSTSYVLECSFCGLQSDLSAQEADRCAAELRAVQAPAPETPRSPQSWQQPQAPQSPQEPGSYQQYEPYPPTQTPHDR